MPRSELRQDDGPWYRLYDAEDVPLPAVEAMADASLQGWEVHGLPRVPLAYRPKTDKEMAALPSDIVFFPPHLQGMAEHVVGEALTGDEMRRLGLQILVAPDTESPTDDSWICLRNRAEVNKLMQRVVAAVNRKSPGAGSLVTPTDGSQTDW